MNKIRLHEGLPPYCSSCFSQQPGVPHIDFMAAWDGPVLEGSIKVMIDDLVLCKSCMTEAAALLGLTESVEGSAVKQLQEQLVEMRRERAQLHRQLMQIRTAVIEASGPIERPQASAPGRKRQPRAS